VPGKVPSIEEIVEVNRRVLAETPVRKADRHQLLSRVKLQLIPDSAKEIDERSTAL